MPDLNGDDLTIRQADGEVIKFAGDVTSFEVKGAVVTVVTTVSTYWRKDWASIELRKR
jgi:hypothetical protein